MKFLKVSLFGLLIVLFSFSLYAQNMGSGSIAGMVLSEADSLPVASAKVFAFKINNLIMLNKYQGETDTDGNYKIDNLPQGQYRVYVQADNFVAEFYEDARDPLYADPVKVDDGAEVMDIDFYLKVGGTISGVVVDSTGVGIPNALVVASPHGTIPRPALVKCAQPYGSLASGSPPI